MDEVNEEWRPVVGWENWYEVSNRGQVRCVKERDRTTIGRPLRGGLASNGYLTVCLRDKSRGKRSHLIHRLVALAFLLNPGNKRTVNHKNGIKTDNRVENLEWATQAENNAHALGTGLRVATSGERHSMAKLTEAQVIEIRALRGRLSYVKIAAMYGVKKSTINSIMVGDTWVASRAADVVTNVSDPTKEMRV